jgi:hypothetical protein
MSIAKVVTPEGQYRMSLPLFELTILSSTVIRTNAMRLVKIFQPLKSIRSKFKPSPIQDEDLIVYRFDLDELKLD